MIEVRDSYTHGAGFLIEGDDGWELFTTAGEFPARLGIDFTIEGPDVSAYVTPEYMDRLHFSVSSYLPKFSKKDSGLTEF